MFSKSVWENNLQVLGLKFLEMSLKNMKKSHWKAGKIQEKNGHPGFLEL